MPLRYALVLAVLIVASPVAAAVTPQWGPWGPGWDPSQDEIEGTIFSIVTKVAAASSYALKNSLRIHYYEPNKPNKDLDGTPIVGAPRGAGSPASAYMPHEGRNTLDTPVLYATTRLFIYARTRDEGAFILAHEIAHLELDHFGAYDAACCRFYREWKGASASCPKTDEDRKQFLDIFPRHRQYLDAMLRSYEFDADARGIEIAASVGYDPRAALNVLRNAAELRRIGEVLPGPQHPDPNDRLQRAAVHIARLPVR